MYFSTSIVFPMSCFSFVTQQHLQPKNVMELNSFFVCVYSFAGGTWDWEYLGFASPEVTVLFCLFWDFGHSLWKSVFVKCIFVANLVGVGCLKFCQSAYRPIEQDVVLLQQLWMCKTCNVQLNSVPLFCSDLKIQRNHAFLGGIDPREHCQYTGSHPQVLKNPH